MDNIQFNLPVKISKWHVSYKPLPFLKENKLSHYIAYDYVNNISSFTNEDLKSYQNKKYEITLSKNEATDSIKNGNLLLKHHYLYKKKSWKYPDIKLIETYDVFLPYEFNVNTMLLREEISGEKKS
ncbi:hypothetical protein [Macrococcus animalis]|uniref:hypothetical protein n=1 Tax=Macrococcus animalis TaxID=3395467 RepID=UPI0039BEAB18